MISLARLLYCFQHGDVWRHCDARRLTKYHRLLCVYEKMWQEDFLELHTHMFRTPHRSMVFGQSSVSLRRREAQG